MARPPKVVDKTGKSVEAFTHDEASRRNLPTAEFQSVMREEEQRPIRVAYERRNRDLDPQLIWRGKYPHDPDRDDPLVVPAPPLYIQEKVHPKVIIDDLRRRSQITSAEAEAQVNLFSDFNGLPSEDARTEFYQHDAHWSNRMILGDSLQVMASLAERERLRGKVQCIYLDPPYGIKFNSNFQWSTTSRDVKDGNVDHITREPEQVKAFRDTWRDGIHSYLSYLRDRLIVARELLTESGSIFVQISDENVHRVRALLDEAFGVANFVSLIAVRKSSGLGQDFIRNTADFLIWYSKSYPACKFRPMFKGKVPGDEGGTTYRFILSAPGRLELMPKSGNIEDYEVAAIGDLSSSGATMSCIYDFKLGDKLFKPTTGKSWKTTKDGMTRLLKAGRIAVSKNISYIRLLSDYPIFGLDNIWTDVVSSFMDDKVYVVQTNSGIIERCILMTTDPGDLVLDPTCGSGTTAYVAEQWGRRWITIDTSRVALALARARIMGARYSYYLLADSPEGQLQEAKLSNRAPLETATQRRVRQGFVYERVPHITLKSIANNAEIDVIYDDYHARLEPLREQLNASLGKAWQEWEIPREADTGWADAAKTLHAQWWEQRIARQRAIDASIAAKAESEFLYDKPYEDKKKVRVSGPFTVESLSPHRVLAVNENDELVESARTDDPLWDAEARDARDFVQVMLETLRTSGVQQAHKEDRITFSSLTPWPGDLVCAEGRYQEGSASGKEDGPERRAAILIGPEFGTLTRLQLVRAAREAGDGGFDILIACAFSYDAHSAELDHLGRVRVLKARMNADLHMATDLKNTGKGNLFVIFGEPDIEVSKLAGDQVQVRVRGVDVFQPSTGEVRSSGPDGIACWFLDTDYNEESFFVRHAYFLGSGDPYKSLKTTLKAEIDEEAWASLNSDTSRPFPRPESGRVAVKVINHLGDEVMKVFRV